MPASRNPWLLAAAMLIITPATADDELLLQRLADIEKRLTALEQQLEERDGKERWKDPILWQRIKKEMPSSEVKTILGRANRIEEQVFTTWYYHPTSKLHSYIWFDEGRVLGWNPPE